MLAEEEMHKAKLKVVVFIATNVKKGYQNPNALSTENVRKMVGYSDWILASNRYGFKIDKIKTSLPI